MRIIKETLDNGLTVVLVPMPGTKTVTGVFAVRAGWKYETLENHVVAHFLEHMAFKGTKNRPTTLDISKEIYGRGGVMNASTSEEMTNYWIKMPYQFENIAVDVISDMLLNSKLEEEEIEREKGTIIQELRMYHDIPQNYISSIAWPNLLYGDQPAGRLAVGTEESIERMVKDQFIEFLNGLYTAENSIFCLAGRITDREDAFERISNLFLSIKRGGPSIVKPAVVESQSEPALFLEARDIQQSHLILGVRSYNIHHSKKFALEVLEAILGGNMSSRMFIEIRERRGLAYYTRAFCDMQSDVGSFGIRVGLAREKVLEGVGVIMNEYRKICEEKVPGEEIKRAKEFIIGSSQMSLGSSNFVASNLARQWVLEGKIEDFSVWAKKIKAVTTEDVQEVARDIFRNEKLNMAIVGPHAGMEEEFLKILKF